jgi:hypothetical protein
MAVMKKNILILCIGLFTQLLPGQIDSSDYKDHCLYLYKTEEDFFTKKKTYRGQYIPGEETKIIKYEIQGSKKRVLNLEDSCVYYFGYRIGDEIQIRPDKDPRNSTYYSFGGGTPDFYCVVYGRLANYDRKGYLLGLTSPGSLIHMYFIDKAHDLNMVQLPEFLKSKPKLLEQYKNEKAKTSKLEWERNKLAIGIKYLKLFIAAEG